MKKKLTIIFLVVSVFISRPAAAQTKPLQFADIQPKLEAILPANFFEIPLVRKERTAILSTIELFNQMIELLKSVNQRE